jgi:hypothetical protein
MDDLVLAHRARSECARWTRAVKITHLILSVDGVESGQVNPMLPERGVFHPPAPGAPRRALPEQNVLARRPQWS